MDRDGSLHVLVLQGDEAVAADWCDMPGSGDRAGIEPRLGNAGRAKGNPSLRGRGGRLVIHASDQRDAPVTQMASGALGSAKSATPWDFVVAFDETAIRNP